MNIREFAAKVKEMRNLQRKYFTTRDHKVMTDCKIWERHVDKLTEEILEDHARLFS